MAWLAIKYGGEDSLVAAPLPTPPSPAVLTNSLVLVFEPNAYTPGCREDQDERQAMRSSEADLALASMPLSTFQYQRVVNRLVPLILVDVEDDEVAVELPVRPRPAALLRGARHRRGVRHARFNRSLVVGAELA